MLYVPLEIHKYAIVETKKSRQGQSSAEGAKWSIQDQTSSCDMAETACQQPGSRWIQSKREMGVYLVLVGCPHVLYNLLGLGLGDAALLGQYLCQDCVDFAGHVCGIAAHVDVCLLGQEVIDLLCHFLETMLDVNLLGALSREGGDELELVTKVLLILLRITRDDVS